MSSECKLVAAASAPGAVGRQWAVAGRTTTPGAATISTLGLPIPIRSDGFFIAAVPGARWNALRHAQGRISILDGAGNELLASCARMAYSPDDPVFAQAGADTSTAATDFTDASCEGARASNAIGG